MSDTSHIAWFSDGLMGEEGMKGSELPLAMGDRGAWNGLIRVCQCALDDVVVM